MTGIGIPSSHSKIPRPAPIGIGNSFLCCATRYGKTLKDKMVEARKIYKIGVNQRMPPIAQITLHSSSVTGCTESRAEVTSDILDRRLSALMSANVTGRG